MNNEIVAIYCLYDDILKAMNHRGDTQQQMSDAEVMTTAIVASVYFFRLLLLMKRVNLLKS
jgi:hypothetical protein